jgi:Ubiquitin elongating factor core
LKEDKKAYEGNQEAMKKIDQEMKNLKNYRLGFELALCDQALAKMLEKFFTVHIQLMREWGEYDEKTVKFGGNNHPNLFCYLPENFLTDFIDSFTDIMRTNSREYRAFMPETIVSIYEFCLAILRTDQKSITNPYTKAKALELMTLFVYSDQKKELMNYFIKSDVINRFLMETVIQFYVHKIPIPSRLF